MGALVAVLAFGALNSAPASATPSAVTALGCEFLIAAIDGDPDDVSSTLGADGAAACNGITNTGDNPLSDDVETGGEAETLEAVLGDGDGTWEPGEADEREFDANQLRDGGANDLYLWIIVTDDDAVTVDPKGLGPDLTDCAVAFGADEDCNADGTGGDRLIVGEITDTTAVGVNPQSGDTVGVDVTQEGVTVTIDINVVGAPDNIEVVALKDTVQTLTDDESCDDVEIVDILDANGDADKVGIIATITDNDGTELARVSIDWESDDTDVLDIAQDERTGQDPGSIDTETGVSVESDDTTAAAAVFCGQTDPGTATVTASFDDVEDESSTVEITVVGEPAAVALVAAPTAIACDGSQTSTVTATVTDSDGNPVADGTNVNFSVVALGTADPINADTVDGVASSTIRPLSGATAGVTVIVTAGDAQASLRVDCSLPIPPTPGGPVATPTRSGITGPDTGNGGYTENSSGSFPMWTLAVLALGSVVLVAGGLVARRAGK
jgi:hypothetical protein